MERLDISVKIRINPLASVIIVSEFVLFVFWVCICAATSAHDATHSGAKIFGATLRGVLHFGTCVVTCLVYDGYIRIMRYNKKVLAMSEIGTKVVRPRSLIILAVAMVYSLITVFDLFSLVGATTGSHPVNALWRCLVTFNAWALLNSLAASIWSSYIWKTWTKADGDAQTAASTKMESTN